MVAVAVGIVVGVMGSGSLTGVGKVEARAPTLAGKPGANPVGVAYSPHRDGFELQALKIKVMAVRKTRLCFTM